MYVFNCMYVCMYVFTKSCVNDLLHIRFRIKHTAFKRLIHSYARDFEE